jgi:hypothetical protein
MLIYHFYSKDSRIQVPQSSYCTYCLSQIHLKRFKYNNGYLEKLDNHIEVPFDIGLNSISDSPQQDNKY